MSEPFIGEIKTWALTYAPRNWAFCDGQLLPISQNTALFSIVGTTFGGDGRVNFGVPDLRGRAPMHAGTGTGLTRRRLGDKMGVTQVTLDTSQLPVHTHDLNAGEVNADTGATNNAYLAKGVTQSGRTTSPVNSYSPNNPAAAMNTAALQNAGGNQAHNNVQPYLSLNMCIALAGTYPSRS